MYLDPMDMDAMDGDPMDLEPIALVSNYLMDLHQTGLSPDRCWPR